MAPASRPYLQLLQAERGRDDLCGLLHEAERQRAVLELGRERLGGVGGDARTADHGRVR